MVDARRKVDGRRLEGVIGGKLEDEAEATGGVDGVGGRRDGDVPGV